MIPTLCFITDAGAPLAIPDQAERAARGGAGWIQLRHKTLDDADFADLARALIDRLAPLGAALIVNDRRRIARAVGAAGVHIGQSDGDPRAIRSEIGPDMILGLSVGTPERLAAVPKGAVDYIGTGPVRATPSKRDHAEPIGIDGVGRIARASALPCLAIGGLRASDMGALRAAGCAGAAVISAISRAPDPQAAARGFLEEWSPT